MKVIVLDDYQDAFRHLRCAGKLDRFEVEVTTAPPPDRDALARRLHDADAIVPIRERTKLDAALLERLPRLRLVAQTGRVGPHVDVDACSRLGIAVAEGVGSPVAPAELTWALVMSAMRRIPQYGYALRRGEWQRSMEPRPHHPPNFGLGVALRGKTLGVWGYGKIGALVAGYGRAFGMDVAVWGSEPSRTRARADGYRAFDDREELFASSDVVTLHLRLSETTRAIVGASDLARMKPTALLVNTSRAELVAPGALLDALRGGRPGLAALDVFDEEPLSPDDPLLSLDEVVATPHLGYVESASYEMYFDAAVENVLRFFEGAPTNVVNRAALERRRG